MKKKLLFVFTVILCFQLKAQKSIYIPNEHKAGINDCNSTYCMGRSYQTDNFLFLWQQNVTPDNNAMNSCEPIFQYYINTMKFASTNLNANINKYKIVVMLDPALTGVAYGSGVDGIIGAMWVGPGMLGGFVFGHELGHCMSFQAGVDGTYHYGFQDQPGTGGSRIYCGPFWETTANYMAYQFNNFQGGANRDVGLYMRCYNYFFTHARSRYEAWPMLEALKKELGVTFLANTWLSSKDPEHPVETIKRVFKNNDQSQVNDLFGKCAMRLVKWDIEPLGTQIRNYVAGNTSEYLPVKFQTLLRPINTDKGRYAVSDNFAPQEYGYNVIKLFPQKDANGNATVYVNFRGMKANDNAGWRYGFVAVKNNGTISYSNINSSDKAIVNFAVDASVTELYFVVVGAPTKHTNYSWEIGFPRVYRFRYEIALKNAIPEGYEANFRKPLGVNGKTHPNGGGFIASTATVASTVYVGPNAKVLGSAKVSGNARIEDWAVITDNAVISGNTIVRGHAVVGGSVNAYDYTIIADEARVSGSGKIFGNAQILDNATIVGGTINGNAIVKGNAFEWGVTIGGSAIMGGDNENTSATSGVYLQIPDSNNGRVAGDGKGASDPSNIDINTIAVSYATDAEMEIPVGGGVPVAAFTASATSVSTGNAITFTDQSANTPTSWVWNFGDGTTSTAQNPTKSYSTAGTYTVSLTAANSTGKNTLAKNNYITVTTGNTSTNIALIGTASTSYVSSWETLKAVNDNSSPANANDKSAGAYGNWNNPNTIEWVEYDWSSNYTISKTEVYWFDDAGGVLTPTLAYVEYWNGSAWVNCGNVPLAKNAWNSLNISGVTSNKFRISMKNSTQSTGILEWRVWGQSSSSLAAKSAAMIADNMGTGEVIIHPNPAKSEFTVELNNFDPDKNVTLYIYDTQGKEIIKKELKNLRKINFSAMSLQLKGNLYFLKAVSGGQIITTKLFIFN